jgi:DNA-directed RNA polymerase subunit RPC12/RpoP
MFNERHFPYEYACSKCNTTVVVTHEDIQDVPSYFQTQTVAEAVKYVMTSRREWSIAPRGPLCPDCSSDVIDD